MLTPVMQVTKDISTNAVSEGGFEYLELLLKVENGKIDRSIIDEIINSDKEFKISGLVIDLNRLDSSILKEMLSLAEEVYAEYIILETKSAGSKDALMELMTECKNAVCESSVNILIENGYVKIHDRYYHNEYSEMKNLVRICEELDGIIGLNRTGICLNTGYINLLAMNIKDAISMSSCKISVVHVNDNDGFRDVHQIPYTFTVGRGENSTDWYGTIGTMVDSGFDGFITFDITGAYKRMPEPLHKTLCEMMMAMYHTWEEQFRFEELLNKPDREIILFGAGRMLKHYLDRWGKKYPPAFAVDNNKDIWGKKVLGVEIKSPEDILKIDADKRNVFICNMNYLIIGNQLDNMGIEYNRFRDTYYI